MEFETVIGLEIHAELLTKTKIFCGCKNAFGGEPNTRVCPVCAGLPGALPVLNKKVIEYALKTGIALNCKVNKRSYMDRKNYFYPDLPKAYQISQNDSPILSDGFLNIDIDQNHKKIGILRIHIEEDAGKLIHDVSTNTTVVDFNRSGVPLIEIVTKPDINSSKEAYAFLKKLKSILEYLEVSDCKMQEGSLRCDINISVRHMGEKDFGSRVEIKNINSFSEAVRAIEYEEKLQKDLLSSNQKVISQTKKWDDKRGISFSMRSKESSIDYRFFKDPDLVPIEITDQWIEGIKSTIPELPNEKKQRFIKSFLLAENIASVITSNRIMAEFFEECVNYGVSPKSVANWITGDILKFLKEKNISWSNIPFSPSDLAKLILMIENGTISASSAKKVLLYMFEGCCNPEKIAVEHGLIQISNEAQIRTIIEKVLKQNKCAVDDFYSGNKRSFSFLIGQAMKESGGRANPQLLNKLMEDALK